MIRWLAAALLLAVTAAPAFACEWHNHSASNDAKSSTVASQPSNDQGATPAPTESESHAPS